MTYKHLLIFLVATIEFATAQTPDWLWAKRFGGTAHDVSYSSCSDGQEYIYMTGAFTCCSIILGADTLTSAGDYDFFIAKMDTSGHVIWAKRGGGNAEDIASFITIDGQGNLYISGYFKSDTIQIGNNTFFNADDISSNYGDLFIAKYDSLGNVLWAKTGAGRFGDRVGGIAPDRFGNVYVTGSFDGDSIRFGNDLLVNPSIAYTGMFIAKYDSSGNLLRLTGEYSGGNSSGNSILADHDGNIFISGYFDAAAIFGGSFQVMGKCITSGCTDYFVAKYDSAGNLLWTAGNDGSGNGYVNGGAMFIDSQNNLLVTGSFSSSTAKFGNYTLSNNNSMINTSSDVYIVKYSPLGNVLWAIRAGGEFTDRSSVIRTDRFNDVYLTGSADEYRITVDTTTYTENFFGGFVLKVTGNGEAMWAKGIYGGGSGLILDSLGSVFVSGSFPYASAYFGNDTLTNIGNGTADIYLARIDSSAHGTITGINSPGYDIQSLKVFPNPVHTNCTIHTEVNLHDAILNVYNVYGQLVLQMNHLSGNQFRIQTEQLHSGVFFLELEEAGIKVGIGNMIVE